MKRLLLGAVFILIVAVCLADELSIGSKAPGFSLLNALDGKAVTFKPGDGKVSVVVFTCNTCPYSRGFEDRIVSLGTDYSKKGVQFFAINPNDDALHEGEKMELMKERMVARKYSFPYLKDGTSQVARSYGARVTPHVFVVDARGTIVYRGYVDDSARAEKRKHTALTDALDALIARKPVTASATKAFGCSIKWKKSA